MNYIRGAVSAISAPYQYYKDLAPLNPSTLTGAIDVIVVRRPAPNGGEELACSPFHVRFGKWQVLRPADKKVTVTVNGQPIPFYMKIGDAGEAFFVFETESDVPDDLITSPLLEATKPGQSNTVKTGRFGAKQDDGETSGDEQSPEESGKDTQEPEPLDLDAEVPAGQSTAGPSSTSDSTLSPASPSSLFGRTKAAVTAVIETERDNRAALKDQVQAARNVAQRDALGFTEDIRHNFSEDLMSRQKGDEALPEVKEGDIRPVEVRYTADMVLDPSGYSSHNREQSDRTISMLNDAESSPSPSSYPSRDASPSPDRTPSASRSPSPEPGPSSSSSSSSSNARSTIGSGIPFPSMRATSAPPPDFDFPSVAKRRLGLASPLSRTTGTGTPVASADEYSWEWGAFPQRSPVTVSAFPKTMSTSGAKPPSLGLTDAGVKSSSAWKGKAKEVSAAYESEGDEPRVGLWNPGKLDVPEKVNVMRSNSVPPEVDGASSGKLDSSSALGNAPRTGEDMLFGAGGRLSARRGDPTKLGVDFFEGGVVEFELSVVPTKGEDDQWWRDEVEAVRRFEEGQIDFGRFLDDEGVVRDEDLVVRWLGDRYITRQDGSPLMDALILWRESALRERARSTTPTNGRGEDDELSSVPEERMERSMTLPPAKASRWMSWWSRSRTSSNAPSETDSKAARPAMRESNSVPITTELVKGPSSEAGSGRNSLVGDVDALAPRLVTEPVSSSATDASSEDTQHGVGKRYAKTLRLSSDQLKSLNLQSGPNTITFSLSASGVAACTARIFVWDHTDLVVISDIDGTITKSDALGHVFTMIGRDWTHLGVAKLYTDICRNGYKIMYLTSRAIGQADATRYYLKGIKQNDYQLPEGPVIMSPDRLLASLHREVIMRKPEVFKMACLRDIQRLFGGGNPFYAGFGNRITDALSYRSVNVPSSRIFTIDSNGEVKMELLELAGYKSSYIHMTDLVDQMFPPIHRSWAPDFTDFNYWKPPMQEFPLPDLSPPSPALSARSDTSNQSTLAKLRHFSLVGSRQGNNVKHFSLPPPATEAVKVNDAESSGNREDDNHTRLRQMSSFERLSYALGGFTRSSTGTTTSTESRRSASPVSTSSTYLDSGSEDEDEDADGQKRRRRERRRSTESMPGSLPGSMDDDMDFDGSDGENRGEGNRGEQHHSDEEGRDDEDVAEAAFDEDILAAGEMANVPFL